MTPQTTNKNLHNIYLSITYGHLVRDHLRLGMLNKLLEMRPDCRVILLTPGDKVQDFRDEFDHERVIFKYHKLWGSPRLHSYACRLRNFSRKLPISNKRKLDQELWKIESRLFTHDPGIERLFKEYPPALVVSTLPHFHIEYDLIAYADRLGYATAAVVKSWDNIQKGLKLRAERIAVWNDVNRAEARKLEFYRDSEITNVGPFPFDRYFTKGVIKDRDEFWKSKGLDPEKPIILYGSIGGFVGMGTTFDESYMMEELLSIVENNKELKDAQVICRLHPSSNLVAFWRFSSNPRVTLSFVSYIKAFGWSMTRDEVDEMANMLAHSDLVVTPGSTLTLEAAIFDTPVIVPVFSTVQPEEYKKTIQKSFDRHLKKLKDNDWVPFIYDKDKLAEKIIYTLKNPGEYKSGREALVKNYIPFSDGKSGERVAKFISDNVDRGIKRLGNLKRS